MTYTRYAIYHAPPKGALARFGADWLGWDIATGRTADQPDLPGLAEITARPRRYGFHATLKPPFRLASGVTADQLSLSVAEMADRLAPGGCDGLRLAPLGRFLALVPVGDPSELARIAATCVSALDRFRAPLDAAELARRQTSRLTDRQTRFLSRWGYPHVMEEFRFHMTLTGRLPKEDLDGWTDTLRAQLPPLPSPFVLSDIALVGERDDGYFEVMERFALGG